MVLKRIVQMHNIWIHPFYYLVVRKKIIIETLNACKESIKSTQSDVVSVVIATNRKIKYLNNLYRKTNEVTDVLSFNQDCYLDDGSLFLGEIIIAFPRLLKQARDKQINYLDELRLLLVHGYLHLMNFNHETKSDKIKMWSLQSQVLIYLGVKTELLDLEEEEN